MSNSVETFREIVLLIAKWLAFCVAALLALAAVIAAIVFGYKYWTYDRHAAKIGVFVSTEQCPNDEFPIGVIIENRSTRTLNEVSFRLAARRVGRSTDIARYQWLSDDSIRKPGEKFGHCWRAPLPSEVKDNPRSLEWSIEYMNYTFRD